MRVSLHPPLLLAPAGAEPGAAQLRRLDHAALWLSVEVEAWQVQRSGHLHLVREPGATAWREVDLGRSPLRALPAELPPVTDAVEFDLQRALAGRTLQLLRLPQLGMVSEIGEGREDFRRRAIGGLRPQLERRLETARASTSSWLPWRRRAAEGAVSAQKERLAAELSTLAASIETVELEGLDRHVRRAEVGVLLVAPEVRLEAPRYRSLMI